MVIINPTTLNVMNEMLCIPKENLLQSVDIGSCAKSV